MNVGGLLLILISVAFDVLLVMLVSARLIFVPMYYGSGFCCPQLEYVYTSTDSEGLVKGLCAVWCLAGCQGGLVCMLLPSACLQGCCWIRFIDACKLKRLAGCTAAADIGMQICTGHCFFTMIWTPQIMHDYKLYK